MIGKPVRLRLVARQDIDGAIDHYLAEAGRDIAFGFIAALEAALEHMGRHPATGSPRHGHDLALPGLRSWPLRRYPYLIFYIEGADHLDVWRVLHAERDIPASLRGPDIE